MRAYAKALEARLAIAGSSDEGTAPELSPCPPSAVFERAVSWAHSAQWSECDLYQQCPEPVAGTSLIVASNSLSECDESALVRVRSLVESSRPGSVAVLVENGTEKASRWLMRLRRDWVGGSGKLGAVMPCGADLGGDRSAHCRACWMSRREAFHETELVNRFRTFCAESRPDRRNWDVFENRLLSWSYAVLEVRGSGTRPRHGKAAGPVAHRWIDRYDHPFPGRFLRRARARRRPACDAQLVEAALVPLASSRTSSHPTRAPGSGGRRSTASSSRICPARCELPVPLLAAQAHLQVLRLCDGSGWQQAGVCGGQQTAREVVSLGQAPIPPTQEVDLLRGFGLLVLDPSIRCSPRRSEVGIGSKTPAEAAISLGKRLATSCSPAEAADVQEVSCPYRQATDSSASVFARR